MRLVIKWLLVIPLVAAASLVFAQSSAPYKLVTVTDQVYRPWNLAFISEQEMLVTEQNGGLRRITISDTGTEVGPRITGVPAVYYKSQGGLFDVLLHPDFASNQILYLSYAAGPADANATEIYQARLQGDALVDGQVIFRSSPDKPTPVHYGGRMALLADNTLLLTTGDGFDFRENAQRLNTLMGKVVRLNLDGTPAADNPYVGDHNALDSIYSYGHRNPQGLAVDSATNKIYLHEHGPRGGDEINIVVPGKNYGWPITTYGLDYSGAFVSPLSSLPNVVEPIKYWVPSIAPSGFAVYRGTAFPQWDGDLFVGALNNKEVRRVQLQGDEVVGEEALFGEVAERIRDVVVSPNGFVYLLTDSEASKIIKVIPGG